MDNAENRTGNAGESLGAVSADASATNRDPAPMTASAVGTSSLVFHAKWDDELFPREGQLALFDLLGSRDKQLIAYTGSHGETRTTAIAVWRDFISWHLRPSDSGLDR